MSFLKIEIHPEFGDCRVKVLDCKYSKECACHYTAGDFRSESGFTPLVIGDNCFSALSDQVSEYHPSPETHAGTGFIRLI